MPSYTCGRCGQESSYQGHYFRSCKSPKWWEGRDGSPLDEANMREHHQCCPKPFGCELDATDSAATTDGGVPVTAETSTPAVAQTTQPEATATVTQYVVPALPEAHSEWHLFALTVERRGPGSWAVKRFGRCLGADGTWDYESVPSERTDEWIAAYRFPLAEALVLAKAAAPNVTVNGWTVAAVLARGGQP